MNDAKKRTTLIIWGIANALSSYTIWGVNALWLLLVMAMFRFDDSSVIAMVIASLPMFANPISCTLGVIYGIKQLPHFRKNATLCIILSIVGFIGYILFAMLLMVLSSVD